MSDSLQPQGWQHARLSCPSIYPRVCSDSCPLSWWWCSTNSYFVTLFSCLNLSQHQGLLQWVLSLYQLGRVLELSFSNSPSNEYSGLISFRIDWFDHLADQGTLKSLLQHHSLKASVLWCSAFFVVQLSHPYMTTGKTIALTGDLCGQSDVSAF